MSDTKLSRAVDMMIRTDHMHKALIDSRVHEIGIHRTQHRILMHLARDGMLPSQKELAERLDITPAAVTGALKKIERDGYVERTLGQDNRYNELKITEKGRELVKLTRRLFSEADTSMFEGFTDEELTTYINCLEKLQENIRRQIGDCHKFKCRKETTDEKMV
ncbi:MAG: MarR family transcriptional regulator [Clostridia bacterium]|nr:MarR family transcriptional regulator [Clostridia bacterium]